MLAHNPTVSKPTDSFHVHCTIAWNGNADWNSGLAQLSSDAIEHEVVNKTSAQYHTG